MLTTYLLVPRLRKGGAIPLLSLYDVILIIIIYVTANGLSTGGSGYFARTLI